MNALDIWHECRRRAVTLSLNGERLHYDGASEAVESMLPTMKAHREGLLACVTALDGALVADGPYWPWGPYLSPERLHEWQRELSDAVDDLAKLEGWPQADRDRVLICIEQQRASTLHPDLAYFHERLREARASAVAREAIAKRNWCGEGLNERTM
ncbi:hypothetical protein [Paraburkholderia sp. MM6662-R1]|uniref:hypothetical protein n=1 Tax=Paraburkholderia sp. MM6662-R1 TaxID=2991066 RepID=UPI003D234533